MPVQVSAPRLTEGRAHELLDNHLVRLADAIDAAWERWLYVPPKDLKAFVARTRANMVYDFICEEIRARFADQTGASVQTNVHGTLLLNIEGLILIRFKKLNKLKLGSNIPTRYQVEFTLQLQLPDLPPEAARLVVGYQLDKAQTRVADIWVTYRVGDDVVWSFSVRASMAATAKPQLLPFPEITQSTPAMPARKRRVTNKKPRVTGDAKKLHPQIVADDNTADGEQRETSGQ